jgi:hypothetical protein
MIPGTYDIEITQGDTYYLPLVTISSLASYGGPVNLVGATVTAMVYSDGQDFPMSVEYVDRAAGEIRLTMAPSLTSLIPETDAAEASWDLEVEYEGWVGTVLSGSARIYPEVPGT